MYALYTYIHTVPGDMEEVCNARERNKSRIEIVSFDQICHFQITERLGLRALFSHRGM